MSLLKKNFNTLNFPVFLPQRPSKHLLNDRRSETLCKEQAVHINTKELRPKAHTISKQCLDNSLCIKKPWALLTATGCE